MPAIKPDQFDASIRSGKIGSLYVFDGPESWLKNRAAQRVIDRLVPAEARDFNLDRLDGAETSGDRIVSAMQSLPWMSERRVVLVRRAEELSADDGRIVAQSLPNLPDSTCLLFLYEGKANLRSEIPAHVSSHGMTITFWPPFANQLPGWVMNEAKSRGKSLAYDAAAALAEACSDLQQVSDELEKLFLFVGKKAVISLSDVRAHGLPDEAGDFRALEEAIFNRDLAGSLKESALLSERGVRAEMILPVFERAFRTIALAHYYVQQKNWGWNMIYEALNVRAKSQQASIAAATKKYSEPESRALFQELTQADMDFKTGVLSSAQTVTLLVLTTVRG